MYADRSCLDRLYSDIGGTKSEPFGKTADGKPVELYTLTNETGLTAKIMTRGATLVQLHVPDKSGKTADVVLGFDSVAGYESEDNQYFGCTTGRVCNRIAKGKFSLDGKDYTWRSTTNPIICTVEQKTASTKCSGLPSRCPMIRERRCLYLHQSRWGRRLPW